MGKKNQNTKTKKKKKNEPVAVSHRNSGSQKAGNNQSIRQQLQEQGLCVHDIAADGHCLFRSMWDQLDGTSNVQDHRELRSVIVDRIEEDKDFFSLFIEDDEPFEEYIKRMRGDGWGGNVEMQACSVLFKCNIRVYQDGMPSWTIQNFPEDHMMLHLSYHDGNHFNSVRMRATGGPASRLVSPSKMQRNSSIVNINDTTVSEITEKFIVRVLLHVMDDSPTSRVRVSFVFKTKKKKKKKEQGNTEVGPVSSKDLCPCGSKKKYKKCCKKRHVRSTLQGTSAVGIPNLGDATITNIYV